MTRSLSVIRFLVIALGALMVVDARATDNQRPTTPQNLQVTSVGAYSVGLRWNPCTDNSGAFSYRVRHSWGYEQTVPQHQTTFTWSGNVEEGRTYSFLVYAVDAAGNQSFHSNTVTVTLAQDVKPPSVPAISVVEVGPTHATLRFSSADDGPHVWFQVYRNGQLIQNWQREPSTMTFYFLHPATTYSFTSRARDFGGNQSDISAPVVIVTPPANKSDTTPPSTPTNVWGGSFGDGSTEFEVQWAPSTDNITPQSLIRYDVHVNGAFVTATINRTRINDYGVFGENVIEVFAVDQAGNRSRAGRFELFIP